ncbi:MAG: hypothetical protein HY927_01545 [Elusimicrobia bacterium]|nr:hypothetical protein [Elusimicrobiota bacterium]
MMRSLAAARFLLAVTRSGGGGVEPRSRTTASGAAFDVYEPAGPAKRTCLLVHGVTLAGKDDLRLRAFARRLAEAGVRAAAADLPGLKSCVFCEGDVGVIADIAGSLWSEYGGPVAMAGFSFGAGLALVAAAREDLAGKLDPVVSFGAYHSLAAIWERHLPESSPPRTEAQWHDHIYLRLAMAFPVMDRLGLSEEDRREVAAALGSYCTDPAVEGKRRAYALVERHSLRELHRLGKDPGLDPALSPAGKLKGLGSRVHLLHDPDDRLVPPEHARRLYEELRPGGRARLLITPLLAHVSPGSTLRGLADIPALLGMMGDLVG